MYRQCGGHMQCGGNCTSNVTRPHLPFFPLSHFFFQLVLLIILNKNGFPQISSSNCLAHACSYRYMYACMKSGDINHQQGCQNEIHRVLQVQCNNRTPKRCFLVTASFFENFACEFGVDRRCQLVHLESTENVSEPCTGTKHFRGSKTLS